MTTTTKRTLAFVIGLALIVSACSTATEAGEGTADAVAAVDANEAAYIEAFFAQDLDAFMDAYTDDAIFVDETFGDYFEGKAAIKSMHRNVIQFADPEQSEVVELFVADDATFAASTWEWIGTNFYGNPFDLPLALIHEYRDGRIAKETIYYASPDAYSQLMG